MQIPSQFRKFASGTSLTDISRFTNWNPGIKVIPINQPTYVYNGITFAKMFAFDQNSNVFLGNSYSGNWAFVYWDLGQTTIQGVVKFNELLFENNALPLSKDLLTQILENDRETYARLLVISEFMNLIPNINSRTDIVNEFNYLKNDYNTRTKAIRNSGLINFNNEVNQAYRAFVGKHSSMNGLGSLGAIGGITIAIGSFVIVGSTVALLLFLRPKKKASDITVDRTRKLENLLAGIDPEIKEKVYKQIDKQLKSAYRHGTRSKFFAGTSGLLKLGILGLAVTKVVQIGKEKGWDKKIKKQFAKTGIEKKVKKLVSKK